VDVRTASRRRLFALVACAVLVAWALNALLGGGDDAERRPSAIGQPKEDPFAYDPDRQEEFLERAAAGFQHPLYAVVPDGPVATAERVNRYREIIEEVAEDSGHDADTLEAMVYLESAGIPEARAGDTASAVGLTQILAETGQNLLGMRIDVARSARLTRQIRRAQARGRTARANRLRAQRRVVDERYDPRKAIEAAARYLTIAEDELGDREDLAVVSYHMGIGNLQNVQRRFGADEDTPYAEIYFDSSPLRHPEAYRTLASFGDYSSTYYFRVLAARDVMRRWRDDPEALAVRSAMVGAKNSREELLRPLETTRKFASPDELEEAYDDGHVEPLPARDLQRAGIRIDRRMGELAERLDQERTLYRGLNREALAALAYLGRGVTAISGARPLWLTSTVRDERYQRQLLRRNREATPGYSLHTTGYAFDILRRYRNRSHALAFQFMLDRLTALDVIAWVREPEAIHVTVGPRAKDLLGDG
jgi:Transglycosylase SLT domain